MRPLAPGERPYALARRAPYRLRGPVDSEGVPLFAFGGDQTYHPVKIAQQALSDLESYRSGGGAHFLDRARREVNRLVREAVTTRDALYYPYRFDFPLGGDTSDMMVAPWYSAMAQGQVLSALVRLFEATDDERLREPMQLTFESFLRLREEGEPWTVFVDEDGYLWFEEYAKDPPMRVLNGHIFAMFGLYDYHRLTSHSLAAKLFRGGAATVARYGADFRDPGGISRYCLRVPSIRNEKYHLIHQEQLRLLTAMTDDPSFARLADQLAADHVVRPPTLALRVRRRIRRELGRAAAAIRGRRTR